MTIPIEYVRLGRTGAKVSNLCIGTDHYGNEYGYDEPTAHQILGTALDGEINFVDTSDSYNDGRSESMIGNYLAESGRRDQVVLATKYRPRYNLLYREAERELLPACLDQGIDVMVYSPQAGGFLLGKHRNIKGETQAGGRFSNDFRASTFYRNTYWNEITFGAMEEFMAVTEKYGVSPMALALKWNRSNPDVSACIVGARTLEQLQQNLVAWEEDVPQEVLDEATAIGDRLWETAPWKPQMHTLPRAEAEAAAANAAAQKTK